MITPTYTVYWTERSLWPTAETLQTWLAVTGEDLTEQAKLVSFPRLKELTSLKEALSFSESLRARRRAGEAIVAITMVAENPDSVGQAGVDITGPDYDWKKRRTQ